jgi:cytochrome-b5 reductase
MTCYNFTGIPFNPISLNPCKNWQKEIISHDTRRFTFDLQTPETRLGLPIGQHISLRFTDSNGKSHQRSYTPTTGDELPGKVTFVIKVYKAGVHPKFPEGGKMSQHLDSLKIGDSIEMRGPKGKFINWIQKNSKSIYFAKSEQIGFPYLPNNFTGHMNYMGSGTFTIKHVGKPLQQRKANHFGMICGGTGITPMLQIINAVFRDDKAKAITISLLYANQSKFLRWWWNRCI